MIPEHFKDHAQAFLAFCIAIILATIVFSTMPEISRY